MYTVRTHLRSVSRKSRFGPKPEDASKRRKGALATKKRGAIRFRRKKRVETSPDKELDAVSFRLTPNMVELASRSEASKPKRRNQFSSALERKKPKFDPSKIS